MGVHGLWRLIEPSGKPVPLETLENKVLAVDISIWLHQVMKGYQDTKGSSVANAHLLGVYHRLCKLLYYRIRPVFVFDGGVPVLKKQTIAKRHQQKYDLQDSAEQIQKQLLASLAKHAAIKNVLPDTGNSPTKQPALREKEEDAMFKLPELPASQSSALDDSEENSSSSDTEGSPVKPWVGVDIDSVDEKSDHFKSLPADIRHDILTELKEKSKHSSWHRIRQMQAESGDFTRFQIKRVLKKRSIQLSLEEAEKEMGGHSLSLGELEALLTEEGVVTASKAASARIASDENTKYLLIKNVQKAMAEAKKKQEEEEERERRKLLTILEDGDSNDTEVEIKSESDLNQPSCSKTETSEFDSDLQKAIALSLKSDKNNSFLENFHDEDFVSDSSSEEIEKKVNEVRNSTSLARAYMLEYSGLTPAEIDNILGISAIENKNSKKKIKVDQEKLDNQKEVLEILEIKNVHDNNVINSDQKNVNIDNSVKKFDSETSINSEIRNVPLVYDAEKFETFSNNFLLKEAENKRINKDDGNNSVTAMSEESTDSDDDFIEVAQSHPKFTSNELAKVDDATKTKEALEVIIKLDSKIEGEDIFADVFSEQKKNVTLLNNVVPEQKVEEVDDEFKEIVKEIGGEMNNSEDNGVHVMSENFTNNYSNRVESGIDDVEQFLEITNNCKTIEALEESVVNIQNDLETNDCQQNNLENVCNSAIIVSENNKAVESTNKTVEDNIKRPQLSTKELIQIKKLLEDEQEQLRKDKAHQDRMSVSITDRMYQETQELLQLFGVPYIIAPMEAEAQCAFLEEIKLTDGTITDDSDIWLFGGKTVYKNFFNQKKHVLEFRSDNIYHLFKLTRQQLILLAMLVGSDYTVGLQGVGPVTALEILAAFPPSKTDYSILSQDELISGLRQFRNWHKAGQPVGPLKTALRGKLKNISISEGFPNSQVAGAYLNPEVETSKERFSWGNPDVNGLKIFAKAKLGWSETKSEEILLPVIKRMQEKNCQKSIKDYFSAKIVLKNDAQMSKRVKKAVKQIAKDPNDSESEEEVPVKKNRTKQSKRKTSEDELKTNEQPENDINALDPSKLNKSRKKPVRRKKLKPNEPEVVTVDFNISPTELSKTTLPIKISQPVVSKEFIPQREKDKINALKTKLKAIEIYRKSKQGPGYLKKRAKVVRQMKDEAELSESSSSD